MSFRAVTWAFDVIRGLSAQEKLVLVALAEFANDDDITWRALEEIAARAECGVRTAKTHLKNLELRGLISRAGRYTWCDGVNEACSNRPPHKHRSGTTYTLHLNVVKPLSLPSSEVTVGESSSTGAKLALVEKSPEFSGKVHRCKTCTCGDCSGSTGATERSPQVQQVAPICNIEPPIKPPIHTKPEVNESSVQAVFEAGVAGLGGSGADVLVDSSAFGVDESLLLACIPEAMRTFDKRGMQVVWKVLKPLLDKGLTPGAVMNYLNSGSLPERVSYMPGLIANRLERMVYVVPSTSGQTRYITPLDEVLSPAGEELTPEEKALENLSDKVRETKLVSRPSVVAMVCQTLASSAQNDASCSELEVYEALLALGDDEFYSLVENALGSFEVAL